jgi:predicted DNA-binding transcriptional regulator YafY
MREKIWSEDQKIKDNTDGSADITFTAPSKSEVVSLILSLGDKAKIVKPKWLQRVLKKMIVAIIDSYSKKPK